MKRNFKLFICYMMIGFSWASTFLYTPTLSTYAVSLGASGSMVGAITGGFGLMQMLCRAPSGMLRDYLGRSRGIMIAGMTAAVLAPLGMYLFPTPVGLMVFRALSGINAAVWPVMTAYVSSQYPREKTVNAISMCNLVNALGNIFGMFLGGWLVGRFSQGAAFLGASAMGLAGLIFAIWLPDVKTDSVVRVTLGDMLRMLGHKRLVFLALMVTVFQMIITGTSMTFTPVLAKSLGATAEELGLLSTLSMVGMLIASMISVRYTERMGGVRNAVGAALFLMAFTTAAIGSTRNLPLLYVLQLFQGIGGYMVIVVLMGDSLLPYADNQRGTAGGLFQSIFAIGMLFGPILAGFIYERLPLQSVYLVLALLPTTAGILMFICYNYLDRGWRENT